MNKEELFNVIFEFCITFPTASTVKQLSALYSEHTQGASAPGFQS